MTDGIISQSAQKVVISINPKSGASDQRRLAGSLAQSLCKAGMDVEIPGSLDDVKSAATRSLAEGTLRAVVAAGGDGTIGLLANLLPAEIPFSILPLGTENLLAKYLGIACDPEQVTGQIIAGRFVDLDMGRANGKLFLVMASCGFDADVVRQLHAVRTGHINHWSYARPIFNSINKYRFPELTIKTEGGGDENGGGSIADKNSGASFSLESRWAFVFNIPRYAMNLPIAPDANSRDGLLDLCTFRGGKILRSLFYLIGVVTRQHTRLRDFEVRQVRRITISSDEPVPYQLDGDPGGQLPLEIEVVPAALRVIVPGTFEQNC